MALLLVVIVLMILLIIGAPVLFAIGTAGISYFFVKPGMLEALSIYAHKFFTGMDSFVFLSIPLFTLAGEIMSASGMMKDLVRFCQMLVGRVRGGLAYVNVLTSMLFGGISGSALADVSALGPLEVAMMTEDGYSPEFSAALAATSAVQGPIIPPSIPMVIFSSLTNASIGALFLGGAVPGILIGVGQMVVIALMAKKKDFPRHAVPITFDEVKTVTKSAVYALFMPVIILSGILSGIFTATEAAAVSVGYSLIVSIVIYRKMTMDKFKKALEKTVRTTASIYLIVAFTSVVGWILAMERLPDMINSAVIKFNISPVLLLFLTNVFFLFNGMWISDTVQLLLFAPIFTPIFANMGIHPVHFGVVMVVNVMLGMITPPYGTALYLAASISESKLTDIVKESLPFTLVSILVLFIITYCPSIVLFLPRMLSLIK